jgi:hypothetical protein
VVRSLVNKDGADVSRACHNGDTPLSLAKQNQNLDILRCLEAPSSRSPQLRHKKNDVNNSQNDNDDSSNNKNNSNKFKNKNKSGNSNGNKNSGSSVSSMRLL